GTAIRRCPTVRPAPSTRSRTGSRSPRSAGTATNAPVYCAFMTDVVIVEAVRTPFGRRNGGLSEVHALDLLGTVQKELFTRSGVDPAEVGQVVGGCVGQVGMQTFNIARTSWLAAGLPLEVAATTVDAQCGSSQQASSLAYGLVASGVVDAAVACGVEVM